MRTVVSVPGKLMILGEHAVIYGYPCIAVSLNKYLTIKGEITNKPKDFFSTGKIKDTRFIKAAVDILRKKYQLKKKIFLETESELGEYGLGSSAAVVVATIKVIAKLFALSLSEKKIFELSSLAILEVQKKASGFDIASCLHGGTIYFDGKTKTVQQLSPKVFLPLVVGFSGQKANTSQMIEKVAKFRQKNRQKVDKIFWEIGQLVRLGKTALEKKDWKFFGQLMNQNHQLLVKLGVSTRMLDNLVKVSLLSGAYGAKLSGAGGGDCMIALTPFSKKKAVEKAIRENGGEVLDVF